MNFIPQQPVSLGLGGRWGKPARLAGLARGPEPLCPAKCLPPTPLLPQLRPSEGVEGAGRECQATGPLLALDSCPECLLQEGKGSSGA